MSDLHMPPALRFMLAARRIELEALESLALNCDLVSAICELVHALQRERGWSNLHLGSALEDHLEVLQHLADEALAIEEQVRGGFDSLSPDAPAGIDRARLFNRIAYVLQGFEELPGLRSRVRGRQITATQATGALTRLIGGLLAVVFEAADAATDPSIARLLVALFNFMQGKELAGQERASGVNGFTIGYFDEALRQRLEHLAQAQEQSFSVFCEFADPGALTLWRAQQNSENLAQLYRMRAVALRTHAGACVDPALSRLWFDVASRRIEALKDVENHLTRVLRDGCQESIRLARADLHNHRLLLRRLASLEPTGGGEQARLFSVYASDMDAPSLDGLSPQLGRSVLDLLHAHTQQPASTSDQLEQARRALTPPAKPSRDT
ncbi:nitrate- and nitrite sensing domain-containing protein [Pseudomonas sp. RIT-PI-S]|uniref:nitrate- and nitrite sensing domain-containing protein n=1 Tax=Pseudomonas sp. RIT-PI-S TaxID=3035295 RepID=UPI0021DAEA86|nr:nitrate- and nitrite sensing domain-containing protein [Pseudomonas sp. RIT-PI-S]